MNVPESKYARQFVEFAPVEYAGLVDHVDEQLVDDACDRAPHQALHLASRRRPQLIPA